MNPDEAAATLKSLVEGRDPSTGRDLHADTVLQRASVIRALLVGLAAIENSQAREKRRAQLPVRVGSAWTDEEDQKLRAAFHAGESVDALAASHQRSTNAIKARLERLDLVPLNQRAKRFPFSEKTDEQPRKRRGRRARLDAERPVKFSHTDTQEE